jgi:hypothetical protein
MVSHAPQLWRLFWYMVIAWLVLFALSISAGAQQSAPRDQQMPVPQSPQAPTSQIQLSQVQAADLMSELLTWSGDRANARVDALSQYLQQKGLIGDFRKLAPQPQQHLAYDQVFRGAVDFVQGDGKKYADPALARLDERHLRVELAALQAYNLQQYQHLCKQRDTAAAMRAYLEQKGQFQDYLTWAGTELTRLEAASTQPAATRPSDVAVRLQELPAEMKESAWHKAQARGVSRKDFDAGWERRQQQYRQAVTDRVAAALRLAQSLDRSSRTLGPAQPAAGQMQGNPSGPSDPLLQSNDPRWNRAYYFPDPNWNSWGDNYSDVSRYEPRGGVYRSYDSRLNQDYDLRVDQERDRRVNADPDRRQNIRIDPHVNY